MALSLSKIGDLVVTALSSENYGLAQYVLDILKSKENSADLSDQYLKIATHVFSSHYLRSPHPVDLVLSARGYYLPEELAVNSYHSYDVAKEFLPSDISRFMYGSIIKHSIADLYSLMREEFWRKKDYVLYELFGGEPQVSEIDGNIESLMKSGFGLDYLDIQTKESAKHIVDLIKRLNAEGYKANFEVAPTMFIRSLYNLGVGIDYRMSLKMKSIEDVVSNPNFVIDVFEINDEQSAERVVNALTILSRDAYEMYEPFKTGATPFITSISKYKLINYEMFPFFRRYTDWAKGAKIFSNKQFLLHNDFEKLKAFGGDCSGINIKATDEYTEGYGNILKGCDVNLDEFYVKNRDEAKRIINSLKSLDEKGYKANFSISTKSVFLKSLFNPEHELTYRETFLYSKFLGKPLKILDKYLLRPDAISVYDFLKCSKYYNNAFPFSMDIAGLFLSAGSTFTHDQYSLVMFIESSEYDLGIKNPLKPYDILKSYTVGCDAGLNCDNSLSSYSALYDKHNLFKLIIDTLAVGFITSSFDLGDKIAFVHPGNFDKEIQFSAFCSLRLGIQNTIVTVLSSLGLNMLEDFISIKAAVPLVGQIIPFIIPSMTLVAVAKTALLSLNLLNIFDYIKASGNQECAIVYVSNDRSTIIHELAHCLFAKLYNNLSLPYPSILPYPVSPFSIIAGGLSQVFKFGIGQQYKDYQSVFYHIIENIKASDKQIPETLSQMLGFYTEWQYECELVVRYPEIIVFHGQEVADKYMPGMKEYWQKYIIPDAIEYMKSHANPLVEIEQSYSYEF